jgi:hypothetical protein
MQLSIKILIRFVQPRNQGGVRGCSEPLTNLAPPPTVNVQNIKDKHADRPAKNV